MGNNVVITIGREFGSGGREIGKKVADRLGIKFMIKSFYRKLQKKAVSAVKFLKIRTKSQRTVSYIL